MKINVLYESNIKRGYRNYTSIEIPDEDYNLLLDADYEQRLAEAAPDLKADVKRCESVQEMFDLMNDAEYKNWRRYQRHNVSPEIPHAASGDSELREREYEAVCEKLRSMLKPDYAEMLIAIHIDGMSCKDYAASIGEKPNTVNHRLQRAEKRFKKLFPKTSLF